MDPDALPAHLPFLPFGLDTHTRMNSSNPNEHMEYFTMMLANRKLDYLGPCLTNVTYTALFDLDPLFCKLLDIRMDPITGHVKEIPFG